MLVLPTFSLKVVTDSGSHTIIGALNNPGLMDLFVIWELSGVELKKWK